MADVDAFDAQWGLGEPEGLLDVLQRSRSRGEVTGPPQLVLSQGLLGIAMDGFGQGPFVTALRYPHHHPGTAQPGQPLGQFVDVGWQARDEDLPRHRVDGFVGGAVQFRLLAVELGQELFHQRAVGRLTGFRRLFHDPAALAPDPTAPDVEDLHGGLEVVAGEGHHIGVGAVAEHHRLLLKSPLEGTEIVTQPGGALEVELLSGGIHLTFQVAGETVGPTGQEVAEVRHDAAVLLGADPADARGRAFVDVAE